MIDIHCHILPEMDDGARDTTVCAEMLRCAHNNKIDSIVATPHFLDFNDIDEFLYRREKAAETLNDIVESLGLDIKIYCAAEVFLDSEVFTAGDIDELAVNSSRYMLCEYTLKPFAPEKAIIYAEEIINRGYVPIIAHPERYVTFAENPEIVNELWDMGCMFQINASSLAGHGGDEMRCFAEDLILRGFVDFIGTDAHSHKTRNNCLLDKIDEFPESIDKKTVEYLTEDAPKKVLNNEIFEKKEVEYF